MDDPMYGNKWVDIEASKHARLNQSYPKISILKVFIEVDIIRFLIY